VSKTNKLYITWFDGGGTTGWADFVVDFRAFSRPENYVQEYMYSWECGEFTGTETAIYSAAVAHVRQKLSVRGDNISPMQYIVGGEDFDLVQTVGSKQNVLSPVRFNAVMDWECYGHGIKYRYQNRALRRQITPERLQLFGFAPPSWIARGRRWVTNGRGKDAFAAMQHGVTFLRLLKNESRSTPWKLMGNDSFNDHWDCACSRPSSRLRGNRPKCDLVHPA
jgi:hypothetical protein